MTQIINALTAFNESTGVDVELYLCGEKVFSSGAVVNANDCSQCQFKYFGNVYTVVAKGDQSAFFDFLKRFFSDIPVIKSKSDLILKAILGYNISSDYYNRYFKNANYFAVLYIKSEGQGKSVKDFLTEYDKKNISVCVDNDICVLLIETLSDDYLSLKRYATVLQEGISEELGIKTLIYIGGICTSPTEIASSYKQAETMCHGVNAVTDKKVFSYYEYLPNIIVGNLPEKVKSAMLKPFEKMLGDTELTTTARAFLECDLNINATCKKLFIHRNTLTYRLNKIEKITGLDLRNFSDASTFSFISLIHGDKDRI